MLGDCCALEFWLKYRLSKPKLTFPDIHADPVKLRNTRLAWLDWMIAYCEAEECGGVKLDPLVLHTLTKR